MTALLCRSKYGAFSQRASSEGRWLQKQNCLPPDIPYSENSSSIHQTYFLTSAFPIVK